MGRGARLRVAPGEEVSHRVHHTTTVATEPGAEPGPPPSIERPGAESQEQGRCMGVKKRRPGGRSGYALIRHRIPLLRGAQSRASESFHGLSVHTQLEAAELAPRDTHALMHMQALLAELPEVLESHPQLGSPSTARSSPRGSRRRRCNTSRRGSRSANLQPAWMQSAAILRACWSSSSLWERECAAPAGPKALADLENAGAASDRPAGNGPCPPQRVL